MAEVSQCELTEPDRARYVTRSMSEFLPGSIGPSPLMYGSIDGWRRHLALHGKALIDGALERADRIRARLQQQERFTVIDKSIHETEGVAEWDPLKLCVDVSRLGLTGYQVKEWLQSERQIAAQLGGRPAGGLLAELCRR